MVWRAFWLKSKGLSCSGLKSLGKCGAQVLCHHGCRIAFLQIIIRLTEKRPCNGESVFPSLEAIEKKTNLRRWIQSRQSYWRGWASHSTWHLARDSGQAGQEKSPGEHGLKTVSAVVHFRLFWFWVWFCLGLFSLVIPLAIFWPNFVKYFGRKN